MALRRTGGERTDEILGKTGGGPEGLPHSIIVTADGVEGEVPTPVGEGAASGDDRVPAEETAKSSRALPRRGKARAAKAAARPGRRPARRKR
jgi:DNA topoisomerase-6 subunit B